MRKNGNWFNESIDVFKKIENVISGVFLYYAATCGFIFGWVALSIMFFTLSGSIPQAFVIALRVFYFLLSFLVGLKLTIYFMNIIKK